MMIIRENIEFKRGQDSKKSLGLGYQGLTELFETISEFPGMYKINFWNNEEDADKNSIDFLEFIFEENSNYDLKEHFEEIGFNKFLILADKSGFDEEYFHKYVLVNADVKPQYQELFGIYAYNFADKDMAGKFRSMFIGNSNTNESINFKRGIHSKEGLNIGMDYILKYPFHFPLFPDGIYEVFADDTYKKSREKPEDRNWNTRIEMKKGKIFQIYKWSSELHDTHQWADEPIYLQDPDEWVKNNDVKKINYVGPNPS